MQPNRAAAPGPQGLYDPRFEHDACGVSFVADIKGRASHAIVDRGIGALCNLEHRGATGAEADTGDGAGVLIQVPHRFLRRGHRLRAALRRRSTRSASRSCRPTSEQALKAVASIEAIVADEGLTVLGWRDVPTEPDCLGATALAAMPAFKQLFVTHSSGAVGHRPGPPRVRGPQARRARAARGAEDVLPVAVGAHARLQGHVHDPAAGRRSTPTCATSGWSRRWRWCTAGSRPTRSRPGRWPTRTGSSPTTARSTRCRATATGCAPARRCSRPLCSPGWSGPTRSARRVAATRRRSTRCSSCSTSAAARCPTRCS